MKSCWYRKRGEGGGGVEAHERLAEDLTCGVCLEEYKDPRALPCLHVYCRTCLDVLISQSADPKTVTCPVCRQHSGVARGGGGGVVSFPDPHTQQRMDYITANAYQAGNETGGGGGGGGRRRHMSPGAGV